MPRVLEGLRVIDWSALQVGPCAAGVLSDVGADVIHVEQPVVGEMERGVLTSYGVPLMVNGRQVWFEEHNRSKRGLALDLTKEKGREVMHRLVAQADVFLTNFRPAVVNKLQMNYEVLREYNPRLIYAQASAFSPSTSTADSKAARASSHSLTNPSPRPMKTRRAEVEGFSAASSRAARRVSAAGPNSGSSSEARASSARDWFTSERASRSPSR